MNIQTDAQLTNEQLRNLIAAGGTPARLAKIIIDQSKTIDVAVKCMKEKQKTIDKNETVLDIVYWKGFNDGKRVQ